MMDDSAPRVVSKVVSIQGRLLEFAFIPIARLKAHESVILDRVSSIASAIEMEGVVHDPAIVVRFKNEIFVTADGHHRAAALAKGHDLMICHVVSYADLAPDCRCR